MVPRSSCGSYLPCDFSFLKQLYSTNFFFTNARCLSDVRACTVSDRGDWGGGVALWLSIWLSTDVAVSLLTLLLLGIHPANSRTAWISWQSTPNGQRSVATSMFGCFLMCRFWFFFFFLSWKWLCMGLTYSMNWYFGWIHPYCVMAEHLWLILVFLQIQETFSFILSGVHPLPEPGPKNSLEMRWLRCSLSPLLNTVAPDSHSSLQTISSCFLHFPIKKSFYSSF